MNDRRESWVTTGGDTVTVYSRVTSGCKRDECDVCHREYRWHVKAANGEIVGQGEGHPRFADAVTAAERHHPRVGDEG